MKEHKSTRALEHKLIDTNEHKSTSPDFIGMTCALVTCALLALAGCAENKYIQTTDRLCVSATTREAIMEASEDVLAKMSFKIEKFDVETGLIKTWPLSGAQSFEFWRKDSVGPFNQTEADLQSIQRTVELNISDNAGQICVNCIATTQRLSYTQSQTADEGYASVVETRRSAEKLLQANRQKSNITWIDLARDTQLETEIIKRIEKQLTTAKKESKK
jgi:hypothetical protein